MLKGILRSFRLGSRRYSAKPKGCKIKKRGGPLAPIVQLPWKANVLKNGVRVIKEQRASTLEVIKVVFEAGPRYENHCNHGSSHFIEHLFDKGAKGQSKDDIRKTLRCQGTRLYSRTTREFQEFTFVCFPQSAAAVIPLIRMIVCDLDPDYKVVDEERAKIYAELKDHDINTKAQVFDYMHAAAFQGTSLGRAVIGPSSHIKMFSKDQLIGFYQDLYQPHRMIVSASGPVDVSSFVGACDNNFNTIPTTSDSHCWPTTRYSGAEVCYRNDDLGYAHVAFALEAPGYTGRQFYHMRLLKHVMGHWDQSMTGKDNAWPRMANALACEKAQVANYKPFYHWYRDVGLWGVYFVAKSVQADDMMGLVQYTLLHTALMLSSSELVRAKHSLKMDLARAASSAMGSSKAMAMQMLYTCNRKTFQEQIHRVDAIRLDELKAAAYEWFYNKDPVIAGFGNTEGILDYARVRNGQYWLRL